jgi:preprotein translocase subunit SecB
MAKQLVELEHYFFPEVSVVANPEWRSEKNNKTQPRLNVQSDCSEVEGRDNTYAVELKISIENTDEYPSQYNIRLMAYGILTAHEDLHDKKNNMLVTGSSILYSASREFLLGIMSRGPWHPILLHAMPFHISRPDPEAKKTKKQVK